MIKFRNELPVPFVFEATPITQKPEPEVKQTFKNAFAQENLPKVPFWNWPLFNSRSRHPSSPSHMSSFMPIAEKARSYRVFSKRHHNCPGYTLTPRPCQMCKLRSKDPEWHSQNGKALRTFANPCGRSSENDKSRWDLDRTINTSKCDGTHQFRPIITLEEMLHCWPERVKDGILRKI